MARDRLAAMRVSIAVFGPPQVYCVLIGDSSGSADCGQLFQQVCLDRISFFNIQPEPFSSSSYPTQRSGNDGGYPRRQNPYAQQDDNASYEMSDVVNPSTAHLTANMAGDTMALFYDEVVHSHRNSNSLN